MRWKIFAFYRILVPLSMYATILTQFVSGAARDKFYNMQELFTSHLQQSVTCKKDADFAWCIPPDYKKDMEPWKYRHITNSTLPWNYFFHFGILDVQEVNDKKHRVTLDMYFKLKWFEPRVNINATSVIWNTESVKIDGDNYMNIPLDHIGEFWIPDLEMYGLEEYQPQHIMKPVANLRINQNHLLRYTVRVKVILSCQMDFEKYPFDSQKCPYIQGSFYNPSNVVSCTSEFYHNQTKQRSLQYEVKIMEIQTMNEVVYGGASFAQDRRLSLSSQCL